MSVYEQEIASLLGPLVAALAEEAPAQPADYPADDDEAIIIIEGLLEIVRAFVSETATSCNELRRVQQEWSAEVKRKKAGERLTADTEYERVMNDQNFDDVMRRAKARQKVLVVMESELNVRMKRCRLRIRNRAPAAPPIGPPPPRTLKLPAMQLRKFNGNRADYRQFAQTFRAVVHQSTYHELEKFACLLGQLEGDAAKVVAGLAFEATNYQVCLDLLERAYGDSEATARELRLRLQALPVAKDPKTVRALFTESETLIRQLQALGNVVASDETILCLEQKLPQKYIEKLLEKRKVVVSRAAPNNVFNLAQFRDALGDLVSDDDKVQTVMSQVKSADERKAPAHAPQSAKDWNQRRGPGGPSMAFVAYERSDQTRRAPNTVGRQPWACAFCQGSHNSRDCQLSVRERREKLRNARKCFLCMRTGHFVRDCQASKCWKCSKAHNSLVCDQAPGARVSGANNMEALSARETRTAFPKLGIMKARKPYEAPSFNMRPEQKYGGVRASGDARVRFQAPMTKVNNYGGETQPPLQVRQTGVAGVVSCGKRANTQMMSCVVKAYNLITNESVDAVIFVDPGSSESYITASLVQKLALAEGPVETIQVARFGDRKPNFEIVAPRVYFGLMGAQLELRAFCGLKLNHILAKISVIGLAAREARNVNDYAEAWPSKSQEPDVLIGMDNLNQLRLTHARELGDGLSLYETSLGPIICGKRDMESSAYVSSEGVCSVVVREAQQEEEELRVVVGKFLSQETCGLEDSKKELEAIDREEEVLAQFRQTIRYVKTPNPRPGEPPGRYQVALPWIDGSPPKMPSNLGLTVGRLRSTLKRLRQKPQLLAEYDQTMRAQMEQGILERIPDPRWAYGPVVHYLPHQAVIKESSETTKLRIVFDASSGDPCLNDALEKGRVYAGQDDKQICFILARVRTMANILVMDLEKAFLQIEVRPQDRDATRILWPADPWSDEEDPEVYRFARVTFGLSSAPFLLGATVEYHLEAHPSEWSRKLINGSYVDNYILPIDEASVIPRAVSEIRELFWSAGFNCRQFGSNCRQQIEALPSEWQETRVKLGLLGVKWNTETDALELALPVWKGEVTRRTILSTIASIYDPCGWIGPCILPAKRFQAELWRAKLTWDDRLPDDQTKLWFQITETWKGQEFCLPRCPFEQKVTGVTEYQLHGFADASTSGIGLVVYARRTDNGEVGMLFAKSLVIPTSLRPKPKKNKDGSIEPRDISVPRLELQATYLLGRAMNQLVENLRIPIVDFCLWTDASTVIHWLRAGRHREIFVENRLAKLRSFVVKHIDTEINPADLASRGLTPSQLQAKRNWELWSSGPPFLSKPEQEWPTSKVTFKPGDEERDEEAIPFFSVECVAISDPIRPIIQAERFCKLDLLVNAMCCDLRFLKRLAKGEERRLTDPNWASVGETGPMRAPERKWALQILIKDAQRCFPADEATDRNLRLFEDSSGVLRCKGRLQRNQKLPEETIFPIYLPKNAPLVSLILRDLHIRLHHAGAQTMIATFRLKFWTPQLRRLISKVLYENKETKCLECAKFRAKPFLPPPEPPLPVERMEEAAPFSNVGVDFFGPFRIKIGESVQKMYGVIFACLSVRAVHLEVCTDATGDKFLLALRRFVGRRGTPKSILSDNAGQFKLSRDLLTLKWVEAENSVILRAFLTQNTITWKFVTERAPWRGATYERMIGLVKHHLKRVLGRKCVGLEEFNTLLIEVERVVNMRPLSFLSENLEGRAVRPIDFLQPMLDPFRICEPVSDHDSQGDDRDFLLGREREIRGLTKLYQRTINLLEQFWQAWRDDYLLSLRERWRVPKGGKQIVPREGQVVLVKDENLPRNVWKMARIMALPNSRTALIKMIPGSTTTRRATNHLYPLEIEEEITGEKLALENNVESESQPTDKVSSNGASSENEGPMAKRVRKSTRRPEYDYGVDDKSGAAAVREQDPDEMTDYEKYMFIKKQSERFDEYGEIFSENDGEGAPETEDVRLVEHFQKKDFPVTKRKSSDSVSSKRRWGIRGAGVYYIAILIALLGLIDARVTVRPPSREREKGMWRVENVTSDLIMFRKIGPSHKLFIRRLRPGDSELSVNETVSWANMNPPLSNLTNSTAAAESDLMAVVANVTNHQFLRDNPVESERKSVPAQGEELADKAPSDNESGLEEKGVKAPLEELREFTSYAKVSKLMSNRPTPRSLISPRREAESLADSYLFCRTNHYELWSVPPDITCGRIADVLGGGRHATLRLYTKYSRPEPFFSHVCARKTETVLYYVNLFGDKFTKHSVELLPVSTEECREMVRRKESVDGPLVTIKKSGLLTTNKPLNIAFPGKIKGFFLGEQSAHVTNSMIEETEVFVNFDNFMMSSLAHDVSKCEFLKEGCIVDGLTFVWEAKCWEGKPCAPCSYVPSTTVEGIFGNKLFISNDHEIALSFQKKVVFDKLPRARACNGAELIISEQGMGVSREDLMPLFAPAAPKRKRREAATTEELAVELTALEASLLSTIARIHNRMCRQIKPDVGNPTKVARRLSKRGDLMARWASANVLQVFPCAKLDKSAVVPRKAASCYQYLPVQVDVPDIGRVDAFLDLELGIVSATSSEADCRMFRYHFLRGKTGMLKFDVLTGELEKVGAEMVHQIVPGDQVEEWNVTMEAFHDLVLSNESDVFSEIFHAQHVEELRREDHWKDQDEVISTSKSRALSATPHTLPGVVRAYFFGYFHVAHEVWINVCAGITTVVTLSIVVVFCLPAGLVNIVLAGGRALMKIPRAVRTLVPAKAQREAPRDRVIEEAVGQREATGLRPPPKPPRLLTLPRWPSVGRNEPGESTSAAPATLDVTWQNPATERMERIIEAHIPSRVRFQRAGGAGTEDTAEIEVAEGPSASAGWTPARLGEKWKNIFQT